MRSRHAVLPSLSLSSRLPKLLSCELIAPEGPRFALFVFNRLHTVFFSVSRKSLAYPCSENGRKSFITALPPLPLISMLGGAPRPHAVSCENRRGECQEFPFWNSPLDHRRYPRAFFSCTYKLPILQTLCFDIHPCNGGVNPPAWFCPLLSRSFRRYSLFPTRYPLCFQTLAHSFALFCAREKLKSFFFLSFRTLCQKHPGGGWARVFQFTIWILPRLHCFHRSRGFGPPPVTSH